MEKTIPFKEDAVKAHLDKHIRYWRGECSKDPDYAFYYVDAYQSMRYSLFGERLPLKEQYEHKDI